MPDNLKSEIRELGLVVRDLKISVETARLERAKADEAQKHKSGDKKEFSPLLLTLIGGIITGAFAILNS
jgi:hypothetical protein